MSWCLKSLANHRWPKHAYHYARQCEISNAKLTTASTLFQGKSNKNLTCTHMQDCYIYKCKQHNKKVKQGVML